MNLDKSKKRIAKKIKMGFKGYPQITFSYFGETTEKATEVLEKEAKELDAELEELDKL